MNLIALCVKEETITHLINSEGERILIFKEDNVEQQIQWSCLHVSFCDAKSALIIAASQSAWAPRGSKAAWHLDLLIVS